MSNSTTSIPRLKQLVMQKWKPQQTYEKVGLSDEESTDEIPHVSRSSKARSWISGIFITSLMVVCIAGIVWWPTRITDHALRLTSHHDYHNSHSNHPIHSLHGESDSSSHFYETVASDTPASPSCSSEQSQNDTIATCGSTIAEAQALGCTWDLLAAAWLPPACIDQELTDDFRAQGPWRYFADHEGKHELFEEELQWRVGEGKEYYASLKYHKTHCSYQWRKMHRAMARGTKIENKLADYHHTMHCGYVQMQQGEMDALMTKISVELMTC